MRSANIKSPQSIGCLFIFLTFIVIAAFLFIGRGRTDSAKWKRRVTETALATTNQSVNIAWDLSTSAVDGQFLYISNSPEFDDDPTKTLLAPTVNNFTIYSLMPESYYVGVTAFSTQDGVDFESPFSNILNVVISPPDPTPSPTATPTSTPTPTATSTPTATASATVPPSPTVPPGLIVNISTRGFVQSGSNALIGGFIITEHPRKVIVRAIGPSLDSQFPFTLENPTLELRYGSGELIAENDNWRSDQEAEIEATGIPPTNDLECAIVETLPSGSYTAIVRGVSGGTGVALVEVYALP